MHVDGHQSVALLVEAVEFLVAGRFGQLAAQPVRPAVVFAAEDLRLARLLRDDGEGAVAADVVEAVDLALTVAAEDEAVLGDVKFEEVAGLFQSRDVGDGLPFSGEDGSPLQLVHLLRCVPI